VFGRKKRELRDAARAAVADLQTIPQVQRREG
jgi:hypothetical protein